VPGERPRHPCEGPPRARFATLPWDTGHRQDSRPVGRRRRRRSPRLVRGRPRPRSRTSAQFSPGLDGSFRDVQLHGAAPTIMVASSSSLEFGRRGAADDLPSIRMNGPHDSAISRTSTQLVMLVFGGVFWIEMTDVWVGVHDGADEPGKKLIESPVAEHARGLRPRLSTLASPVLGPSPISRARCCGRRPPDPQRARRAGRPPRNRRGQLADVASPPQRCGPAQPSGTCLFLAQHDVLGDREDGGTSLISCCVHHADPGRDSRSSGLPKRTGVSSSRNFSPSSGCVNPNEVVPSASSFAHPFSPRGRGPRPPRREGSRRVVGNHAGKALRDPGKLELQLFLGLRSAYEEWSFGSTEIVPSMIPCVAASIWSFSLLRDLASRTSVERCDADAGVLEMCPIEAALGTTRRPRSLNRVLDRPVPCASRCASGTGGSTSCASGANRPGPPRSCGLSQPAACTPAAAPNPTGPGPGTD
jgi:hypothetical protein